MFKGLFHGGAEIDSFLGNLTLAVARIATGCMLAFGHGLGKLPPSDGFIDGVAEMGFPLPLASAWAAALAEFGGGLLLALGLWTRPAAAAIAFTMATAAFLRHGTDPFNMREPALLYLTLAGLFVGLGSGRYGFDRRLRM